MELIGNLKNYDWGKLGSESEVVKLAKLNDETFVIDETLPFSELWMGDHVSGQATLKSSGEQLGDFIQRDRESNIGGHPKLPFLFKVLSIRKALSIQVHPNKTEAERLHSIHPDIYKDPNHKPELAIALTPFLALCDFRPHDEIYQQLKSHDELIDLLGSSNIDLIKSNGNEGLKTVYGKLMRSDDVSIKKCIEKLEKKFQNDSSKLAKVFLQIHQDFPFDVGSLSLFFLNLMELNTGEAIFLGANVPHAYLAGDCIECMSCSDNVVRAGLTPKFKDVENLLNMLIYDGAKVEDKIFLPKILDEQHKFTRLFQPPVEDFSVAKIELPDLRNYEIVNSKFGSIVLVISGEADMSGNGMENLKLHRGKIIFLPSKVGPNIELKDIKENFICYQAMFNNF